MSKARNLSDFISDPAIDSTELGSGSVTTDKLSDQAVTAAKLHNTLDLSSKTVTLANDGISGNSVHGGVISNFASTGIDDNASATAITIDSSGRVGIGNNVPDLALDVYGNMGVNGEASRVMVVQSNNVAAAGYGGGIAFGGFYNGTTNRLNDFAGIQGFKENNTQGDYAGALKFTTRVNGGSPTERMRITSYGSVGIGTQSPDAKLELGGTNPNMYFGPASTGSGAYLYYNTAGNYFAINAVTQGVAYRNIALANDGGNVGIGTDSPQAKLHVSGNGETLRITTATNGYLSWYRGATWAGYIDAESGGNMTFANAAGGAINLMTSSQTRLHITSDGKVGIGTQNPGSKLHISSGSTTYNETDILIQNTTSGSGLHIVPSTGSSGIQIGNFKGSVIQAFGPNDGITAGLMIGSDYGAPIVFSSYYGGVSSYTEEMRIVSNKVGIGTNNPNARLHVIPGASSDTVPGVKVEKDWGSISGAMVYLDGSPNNAGDGNVLLVKGGGTRSDTETFEVRNGNGTTFAVFGSGEIQTGTKLLANPAYGGGAFNVVNSTVDKNLYMPSFYGSGYVNLTYRHCFNITADHFAVQFTGGGGNTVFTTYAIISGSHYRDILVQSYSLFYSHLKIKIVQNGSDGKSIWVAGNTYANNVYFLEWRVFPIKTSSIEMNPSSAQSEFYHVHYASAGIVSSSSDDMPTGTGPSAW